MQLRLFVKPSFGNVEGIAELDKNPYLEPA